jgi:transposase
MKMEETKAQNEQLKVLVENLTKVVTHQEQVITQLRAQLGQDSSNSHRPPSTDGPKARTARQKRNKKPSKRKRGGQPGRKGTIGGRLRN